MSEVNNGLRFDIYERVHLPDNVAAIEELEEIELVPRIQVIDQGDEAVLKGQLVLNGIYRGQGEEAEQIALEHWIPVEISLPMNRVTRLDDITIDIDTFDVDLLSSRALNITGILSLRGIAVESDEQQEEAWDSDAFVASHEREQAEEVETELESEATEEVSEEISEEISEEYEERGAEYIQPYALEQHAAPQEWEQENRLQLDEQETYEESDEAVIAEAYLDDIATEIESDMREEQQWIEHAVESEQAIREDQELAEPAEQIYLEEVEIAEDIDTVPVAVNEEEEREAEQSLLQYAEEEQRDDQQTSEIVEPQIAINENKQQNDTLGIRTILQSSLREQAAHQANLEEEETKRLQEEAENPPAVDDEIEWQNLFLSKRPDQNEFRKIKMCIVQREDTLEQIAMRYSVNPRELLVHNNLHESAISEGQLLYIP